MSHAESSHLSQPERPLAQKITRLERRIRDLELFRPPASGGSSPLSWTFVPDSWLDPGWELPSVYTASFLGDNFDLRYAFDQNAFYLNGYLVGNRGSTKINGETGTYSDPNVTILTFPPIAGPVGFFTRHDDIQSWTYAQVFERDVKSHASLYVTVPIQTGSSPSSGWAADLPALVGLTPSDDFNLHFYAALPW